jgi:protocatechuate 3,4-dioxygenase alpha subunit
MEHRDRRRHGNGVREREGVIVTSLVTPSQTVGPFFHDCMLRSDAQCDAISDASGHGVSIRVSGHVLDGDRAGVPDALIEVWQADSHGRYHTRARNEVAPPSDFTGFARVGTDEGGAFSFTSIKPGSVPFDEGKVQAPHLCVAVFARGLLNHLYTRVYFEDEALTASDPILSIVPESRRHTLVARVDRASALDALTSYRFDVVLQGADETAFFDFKRAR